MKIYRTIELNYYPCDFKIDDDSLDFEIFSILNFPHNTDLNYDEGKKYLKIINNIRKNILDNFFEDELDKISGEFDLEIEEKTDFGCSYFIEKSRYEEFKNYDFPNYIYPDFLEDEPDYDENFNEIIDED